MEIVYDDDDAAPATSRGPPQISPEHPVLVDRFLDDAIEIDVDALYDGDELYLGGVMEHIEEAGIHSGDSACALPPITLGRERARADPRARTEAIARGRRRARPAQRPVRAGRATCSTCWRPTRGPRGPCRSCPRRRRCRWPRRRPGSCSARPIAELRAEGLLPADGRRRRPAGRRADRGQGGGAAVQPVPHPGRARRSTPLLGPEMRSTGEVMGIDADFGTAFAKSPGGGLRRRCRPSGRVFVSVANRDKRAMIFPVKRLADLGLRDPRHRRAPPRCCAATASAATVVRKHSEGRGPDGEPTIVDADPRPARST